MKTRILFVCVHNSARSQMAEAFVNHLFGDQFQAESAGLEPGTLNPLVVEAMAERGIDISGANCRAVWDVFKAGESFGYVITVCDDTSAEKCPVFPGTAMRDHWSFHDPAQCTGSHEEKLAQVREIRDAIEAQVREWCERKEEVLGTEESA